MIFDKHISLFDSFVTIVKVTGEDGEFVDSGELTISNKGAPSLTFGWDKDLSGVQKQTYFQCEASDEIYHLIDCEVFETHIIPRLVVRGGRKKPIIKKVNLLLQGVSQWMDSEGKFSSSKDEIKRSLESKVFNIPVEYKGKKIAISNEHWFEVNPSTANNYNMNIYSIITIEAFDFEWTSSDLISIISDIRTIFTLLLGYSTHPEYVLNAGSTQQSLYFINAGDKSSEDVKSKSCFFPSSLLFKENRWEAIIEGYFNEKNTPYKRLWGRVSGMISYNGFWEYEILAYVSLIDRYVSVFSDKFKSKMSKGNESKLRKELRKIVDEFQESVESKPKEQLAYDSVKEQIKGIKGASLHTFSDKFDFKLDSSNSDIMKILGLGKDDFVHLKRIRDSVAHGDEATLQDEDDLSHEMMITSKFILLLRYWCLIDLGLSHKDFIFRLENWLNPLVNRANINRKYLDQVSGNYIFLETDEKTISLYKKNRNRCLIIDYIKEENLYSLDVAATDYVISNMRDSVEDTLKGYVNTDHIKNIAYASNAYFKNNGEVFKISAGACILNCPVDISCHSLIKDRFIEFDIDNSAWKLSQFEQRIKEMSS